MPTALKLGPGDVGKALTLGEYLAGDYEEGFKYELIDGRLAVSPLPNLPEDMVATWLLFLLHDYARRHPEVINHVTQRGRVFVPGREGATTPEPDITAFRDVPRGQPARGLNWQQLTPVLVAEVLSSDPVKDLTRNVELYLQVPSVREYWVLDIRQGASRPALVAHRRRGRSWRVANVPGGGSYATPLLPDFTLTLDIHA